MTNKAEIDEFSWLVSLIENEDRFVCGAVIVSSSWLMTSANHGVYISKNLNKIKVFAGSENLRYFYNNSSHGIEIEKVINHQNYNPDSKKNDISLIKLKRPFLFVDSNKIQQACFYKSEEETTKRFKVLLAVGWTNSDNKLNSEILQKINLEDNSLKSEIGYISNLDLIEVKDMSSVGFVGDSLAFIDEDGKKYVVGIYSNSKNFTRISFHLPWIKKTIDQPLCLKEVIFVL